jgi:hypothetical protein
MAISKFVKSGNGLPSLVCENPPITFNSKARKTEFIKLEFFMDPSNPASQYARHFVIFKDGCTEEWIKWLMAYCDIESLMPLKEPADKSKMLKTLLKGQALSYLENHLRKRLDAEDAEFQTMIS